MSAGYPRPDQLPNPNYNPAYVHGGINAFIPTLRMDIDEDKARTFDERGIDIEVAAAPLAELFRRADVSDGIRFTAESITVIETGQILTNFQSGIAAIFEIDDVVHLKLATGDVVEVKFYRG